MDDSDERRRVYSSMFCLLDRLGLRIAELGKLCLQNDTRLWTLFCERETLPWLNPIVLVVVRRARVRKKKADDDRGGKGRKEGFGGGCAATTVWPVDYGAETSAGVSLQPVSDSVFARGYKEKDGESKRIREGRSMPMRRRKREPEENGRDRARGREGGARSLA